MNLSCYRYGIVLRNTPAFSANNQACSISSAVLALPTVVINLSMILVLLSKRYRSKPCETFLLNLAVTDVFAGLFNMTCNYFMFDFISESKNPCRLANITLPVSYIFGITSFLTLIAVAVERYINVFHPYKHSAKFHTRNVVIIITLTWVVPITLTVPNPFFFQGDILRGVVFSIGLLGTLINAFCYVRILWFARKIRLEVAATEARYGGCGTSIQEKGERSLVKVGAVMIITVVICYAPICSNNFLTLMGYSSLALDYALCWGWVLSNASSLIDPIITCYFNPDIRRQFIALWKVKLCRLGELEVANSNSSKEGRNQAMQNLEMEKM